ncbi:Kinesin motor domain [Carpediemonas membranifera]|uniref:Kinesin-like protein n=1 Tax=Carpediemonas membranifera TaxID=201153 RepID=A0A8J6BUS8_9EUKA|nr:Kinesin motor domain [Carpediemonas membranifera]|eukprot:KAG9390666.1 Kinesin motor domain [Carpediemonas membranifera]
MHDEGRKEDGETSIVVSVRVRPETSREISFRGKYANPLPIQIHNDAVILLDPDTRSTDHGRRQRDFVFDHVFTESASNEAIFRTVALPLVRRSIEGYNGTCFAYGVTGAGKTYTMIGSPGVRGLIHLTADALFQARNEAVDSKITIKMSFLEIYNEHLCDLLTHTRNMNLDIVEDPHKGICVPGLTEQEISTTSQVTTLLRQGQARRSTAPTGANEASSRSHAVLQFTVISRPLDDNSAPGHIGKLSLIDLAGSERAAATENRGLRMTEGAAINRSLLALSNCINALGDIQVTGRKVFVPYRDSKLTRLLKDSLGGNTETHMVANIPPSALYFEEILNTLKYAYRAKSIKKRVRRNELALEATPAQYAQIIAGLKRELERYKRGTPQTAPVDVSTVSVRDSETIKSEMMKVEQDLADADERRKAASHEEESIRREQAVDPGRAKFETLSKQLLDNYQSILGLRFHISQDDREIASKKMRLESLSNSPDTPEARQERLDQMAGLIERSQSREHMMKRLETEEQHRVSLQQQLMAMKSGTREEVLDLTLKLSRARVELYAARAETFATQKRMLAMEQTLAGLVGKIKSSGTPPAAPPSSARPIATTPATTKVTPTTATPIQPPRRAAPVNVTPATEPPRHVVRETPHVSRIDLTRPASQIQPRHRTPYASSTRYAATPHASAVDRPSTATHYSASHPRQSSVGANLNRPSTALASSSASARRSESSGPTRPAPRSTLFAARTPSKSTVSPNTLTQSHAPSSSVVTGLPRHSPVKASTYDRESRLSMLHRMAEPASSTYSSYASKRVGASNSAFTPARSTGLDVELKTKWAALQRSHRALGYVSTERGR